MELINTFMNENAIDLEDAVMAVNVYQDSRDVFQLKPKKCEIFLIFEEDKEKGPIALSLAQGHLLRFLEAWLECFFLFTV